MFHLLIGDFVFEDDLGSNSLGHNRFGGENVQGVIFPIITELQSNCSGAISLHRCTIMMSWGKLWCVCFSRTIIDEPYNITMQGHTCNHNHKLFDQTSSECHGLAIPLSRWAGEKSMSPLHSEPVQFGRGRVCWMDCISQHFHRLTAWEVTDRPALLPKQDIHVTKRRKSVALSFHIYNF